MRHVDNTVCTMSQKLVASETGVVDQTPTAERLKQSKTYIHG